METKEHLLEAARVGIKPHPEEQEVFMKALREALFAERPCLLHVYKVPVSVGDKCVRCGVEKK